MDPITAINLGLALAKMGLSVWGEIKAAKLTPQPDGTQTIELTISVREANLAQYLVTEQSDTSETIAEIARRTAPGS